MDNKYEIDFNSFLSTIKRHISNLKLKNSIQKDYILKALFFSNQHLSAEEISFEIKKNYQLNIGLATIYRSLNFFEELNIVNVLNLKSSAKKYELNINLHHDHLVCVSCHKIIEFTDEIIEKKQLHIAEKKNFKLTNHVMTIYGLCKDCQS